MIDPKELWDIIEEVREKNPLVHSITNFVAMNVSANVLLAFGASPAMLHSADEVTEFVRQSDSLVINVGTLDSSSLASMRLAAFTAEEVGCPWILDPVGVGVTFFRQSAILNLVDQSPYVIRGNSSEVATIAKSFYGVSEDTEQKNEKIANLKTQGKGVDSTISSQNALDAAIRITEELQCVVVSTGDVDYITSWDHSSNSSKIVSISNGHPLMAKVTALGCSLTAIIGACLAVEEDPSKASIAGVAYFGIAGEIAAERSQGPGSMQLQILDVIYNLDKDTFIGRAKINDETR